ncbi:hypothetical protein TEQG_03591 [Trichophyton equinum CBS 127.97]|uniref:Uncharacterized protein n=1 Tax=Trichophyton equinum (strain ATCC MYA-4606 / CBS 127.97) TaxID=559882 RepID=F2PR72_TRIEC|nr:hypothetical protein TEQG_03591 [Trichophyton equinum CBS 127.97]
MAFCLVFLSSRWPVDGFVHVFSSLIEVTAWSLEASWCECDTGSLQACVRGCWPLKKLGESWLASEIVDYLISPISTAQAELQIYKAYIEKPPVQGMTISVRTIAASGASASTVSEIWATN